MFIYGNCDMNLTLDGGLINLLSSVRYHKGLLNNL